MGVIVSHLIGNGAIQGDLDRLEERTKQSPGMKEVTILLYLVLIRPCLEHCVQFRVPNIRMTSVKFSVELSSHTGADMLALGLFSLKKRRLCGT